MQVILFCIAVFFSIIVPGIGMLRFFIVKQESISVIVYFLLSLSLGLFIWGAQGYILGWLGLRYLTYGFVSISVLLFLKDYRYIFAIIRDAIKEFIQLDKVILTLIVLGVCLQSIQMIGNGLPTAQGVRFWRTNAYDGVFHLGLIESMKTYFPPLEPSGAFLPVVNYHYWSDLIMSELSRVWYLSSSLIFFQLFPPLLSLGTSLSLVAITTMIGNGKSLWFTRISLFFLLFGSDLGWLVSYLIHQTVSLPYPIIDNGATQFLNMPHSFAKMVFFAASIAFMLWREKMNPSLGILTMVLGAFLFGLKVYFGLFVSFGLLCVFAKDVFINRRWSSTLLLGIVFTFIVAIIYLPVNRASGGLSWYPLEWPKLIINENNLDWTTLRLKLAVAEYEHRNLKIVWYDALLIGVTMLVIHGMRTIGFLFTPKFVKTLGLDLSLFLLPATLIFTFLGFTTLQVSGGFNVFNFFVVSLVVLSISMAFFISEIIHWQKIVGMSLFILCLILSLPRIGFETTEMLAHYMSAADSVLVDSKRLEAYDFLKEKISSDAVIATQPTDTLDIKSTYTTAFTGKQNFLSGRYILETHNQPVEERQRALDSLFDLQNLKQAKARLATLGISHIVIDNRDPIRPLGSLLLRRQSVFGNGAVFVYDREDL